MTIKSFLKPTLLALCLLPLWSCSSLFKPKTMTIEYDEEVKLHDGEMIWVHITRHYGLSSGIFGDPGGMESSYKPTNVEISWDTGFEGVGRKSVYFQEDIMLINKYQDKWYVVGGLPYSDVNNIPNSVNCRKVGAKKIQLCIVAINVKGEFIKTSANEIVNFNSMNILNPVGIKDWGLFPNPLNKRSLIWNEKIELQSHQKPHLQKINKPIAILENQE